MQQCITMSGITKILLYQICSNLGDLIHDTNIRYIKGLRCNEVRYIEGCPLYRVRTTDRDVGVRRRPDPVYRKLRNAKYSSTVARGHSYFCTNTILTVQHASGVWRCVSICVQFAVPLGTLIDFDCLIAKHNRDLRIYIVFDLKCHDRRSGSSTKQDHTILHTLKPDWLP
jgi:hypothetical protein